MIKNIVSKITCMASQKITPPPIVIGTNIVKP